MLRLHPVKPARQRRHENRLSPNPRSTSSPFLRGHVADGDSLQNRQKNAAQRVHGSLRQLRHPRHRKRLPRANGRKTGKLTLQSVTLLMLQNSFLTQFFHEADNLLYYVFVYLSALALRGFSGVAMYPLGKILFWVGNNLKPWHVRKTCFSFFFN